MLYWRYLWQCYYNYEIYLFWPISLRFIRTGYLKVCTEFWKCHDSVLCICMHRGLTITVFLIHVTKGHALAITSCSLVLKIPLRTCLLFAQDAFAHDWSWGKWLTKKLWSGLNSFQSVLMGTSMLSLDCCEEDDESSSPKWT